MPREPVIAGDALLADIEAADPGNGLALWWLGQSAFLVKSAAGRVLINPCLVESPACTGSNIDQSRRRVVQCAINLADLSSIDVVIASRSHIDRADVKLLAAVFNANPKAAFVVPETCRKAIAALLGCDPAWPWGLDDGESVSFGGITVLALSAAHQVNVRDAARSQDCHGYVVWFGDMTVFYGADARIGPELVERLRPLKIDVAILKCAEHPPESRGVGNLLDDEVAKMVRQIGVRLVVPYYDDTANAGHEWLDSFAAMCERLDQPYKILRCGERLVVPAKMRHN